MKILLVYSSKTGNTRKVANAIGEALHICPVPVEENPDAAGFDLVIAGFWVDRGTADARMKAYLGGLVNQKVAIFATLGAEADSEHAAKCLENGAALLGEGCEVVGRFICQGKVADEMVAMMKQMFPAGHPHAMTPERLARIERAASHPDEKDLAAARAYFSQLCLGAQ
ncbi:flavodoxin family protein [Selenomonas ruminantium]|uniref:Flavodoxin n=1 Tax=Selenomonas ruminantium TaxID=971 RepID=A0A1H0UKR6_SELRU|nr:flavodoxin family protein [Selenomonas ruminantium]SDP66466.1 Flavodoxin [Selenomonas ruminantium]